MRYAPYQQEVHDMESLSEGQLLEYFLTRVFESEEVWGLDDGCQWMTYQQQQQQVMPIWPYQQFAQKMQMMSSEKVTVCAESLEDFIFSSLPALIEEGVLLEVMTQPQKPGCLVSPQRLFEIITGMMNAGEYTLDS